MSDHRLGEVEARFADIIWNNEPLGSGELVRLCEEELGWKKSTTYTVLKKLCSRGIFRNEGGVVSSLMSRGDFYAAQSSEVVEESFGGSLPSFIAAFTSRNRLSGEEVAEIKALIDAYGRGVEPDGSADQGR
ncbi:MAG: BlaI/MecI/CopY family transcriptional regulator [Firmicutes bacterium]|nr:BlaI/MecI/CopY family transcriptional regulator [Bacillota bacterium]